MVSDMEAETDAVADCEPLADVVTVWVWDTDAVTDIELDTVTVVDTD